MLNAMLSAPLSIAAPSSITRRMDTLLRTYESRLEMHQTDFSRKLIPASRALEPDVRAELEKRRDELHAHMNATPGSETDHVILLLLTNWPKYQETMEEAAIRIKLYATVVAGYPLWAIFETHLHFACGVCRAEWNKKYRPSTAQFAEECRYILEPYRAELYRLNIVLNAASYEDRVSDEDRVKVQAYARKIRAEMRAAIADVELDDKKTRNEAPDIAEAERKIRECVEAAPVRHVNSTWRRPPAIDLIALARSGVFFE
ncbi:hypothetical protein [Methylobacterium sp. 190mf]|uniref:hypothetical protein n=1 Tax=Methylobacterium sp. 190mf TaxID=1761798 RepID=UPI0011B03426|nr:hypothetical protein [Methylobacterium sp. 190mf]